MQILNKIEFKRWLLIISIILFTTLYSINSFATDYYQRQSGAWNNPNTWTTSSGWQATVNSGTYPQAGDDVYIGNNGNIAMITLTEDTECNNLIFNGYGNSSIIAQGAFELTVNNDWTVDWSTSATITQTSGYIHIIGSVSQFRTDMTISNLKVGAATFSFDNTSTLTVANSYDHNCYTSSVPSGINVTGSAINATPCSPELSATTLNDFGDICINSTSEAEYFTIEALALTTANITISSLSGFSYSTSENGTYTSSLSINHGGGNYEQDIYVKFSPTATISYDGNIVVSGGGASSINIAATGSGNNSVQPTIESPISSMTSLTSAELGGDVTIEGCTSNSITERGIFYSTTNGFADGTGTKVSETGTFSTGPFTINVTGLSTNTNYYYKAFATNNAGTSYSVQGSFIISSRNLYFVSNNSSTDWGDENNWRVGTCGGSFASAIPTIIDNVYLSCNYGTIVNINSSGYECNNIYVGQGYTLNLNGNILNVLNNAEIATSNSGKIDIDSGELNISGNLTINLDNGAGFDWDNGKVNLDGNLIINDGYGSIGGTKTGYFSLTGSSSSVDISSNTIQIPYFKQSVNSFTKTGDGTLEITNTFDRNCGDAPTIAAGTFTVSGSTINDVCANVEISNAIDPGPFCKGGAIDVPYTTTDAFNSGNIFSVQLSDNNGDFSAPDIIGTLTQTTNGTINCTIPLTTSIESGYKIRIASSDPVNTSDPINLNLDLVQPTISCASDIAEQITNDSGWLYQKEITINNTGAALSDYQVMLEIDYESNMKADWSDIRIKASDNETNLNFWIEPIVGTTARVWVRIPLLEANTATTIYLRYGNPLASSASNGQNTFVFFTDIPSIAGWNTYSSGDVDFDNTSFSGITTIKKIDNCDPAGGWISLGTTVTNFRLLTREQRNSSYSNGSCGSNRYGLENGSFDGYSITRSAHTTSTGNFGWELRNNGTGSNSKTSSISQPMDAWYRTELTKDCTSSEIIASIYQDNGTFIHSETNTDANYNSFDRFIIHGGEEYFFDYIAVASYESNTISVNIGTEEIANLSCETYVAVPLPTVNDNSGAYSLTNNFNGNADASDNYPLGNTVVTFTASDCNGNESTCNLTVTVTDNSEPIINCPSNINAFTYDNPITPPALEYTDDCSIPTVTYTITGATTASGSGVVGATNFSLGTSTVEYTVTDASGNFSTCNFDVIINCGLNISDYSYTPISCVGANDATISITATGGNSTYEYSINGGTSYQAAPLFQNLSSGSYTLAVKEPGACSFISTIDVVIEAINDVTFVADIIDDTCNSDIGSINLDLNYDDISSIYFDGTNDYISTNSFYSGVDAITELTVAGWVKVEAGEGGWSLIDFDRSEYFNLSVGDQGRSNDFVCFDTNSDNSSGVDDMNGSINVRDGKWHYITGVYDGTNKYIYVDGVLDATKSNPHNGENLGSNLTRYGIIGDGSEATTFNGNRNDQYFRGNISEVEVWDRALSEGEIKQRMYSNLSGNEDGLQQFWKLDEGSGTSIDDKTGNYTGTIYNGATWDSFEPFLYEWTKKGSATVIGSGLSINALDSGTYYLVVNYLNGCTKSFEYFVNSIDPNPFSITTNPVDIVTCLNDPAVFSIETSTNTGLTYQWYENETTALADNAQFSGTATKSITIQNPISGNTYHVEVTGGCNTLSSDTISFTLLEFNALVRDITESSDSTVSVPDYSSGHCPDLNYPEFNPDNSSYLPGYSIIDVRVERASSATNWEFDYSIQGAVGNINMVSVKGNNSTPATSNTTPMIHASDNQYIYFRFKVENSPSNEQEIKFFIENVNFNSQCIDTNFVDDTIKHTLYVMPPIGSFN